MGPVPRTQRSSPARARSAAALGLLLLGAPLHGEESPPIWADVQLATAADSILPRTAEVEAAIARAMRPVEPSADRGAGRSALLHFDGVVLVTVVTMVDLREETFHVPRGAGDTTDIYHGQVIVAGTVLAFSPLARTVLTTAPLLGVRKLLFERRPPEERLRAEALRAAAAFVDAARRRGEALGGRARRAAIRRSLLGGAVLQAGSDDGVRPGLVVAAVDPSAASGVSCTVKNVERREASLDCPERLPAAALGHYLRSVGTDVERYQVGAAAITSAKARALFATSLEQEQVAIAFAASDDLAERGLTVLPPGGEEGERSATLAVQEFMARHGVSLREMEKFSLRFPPPETRIEVVVDGYNTSVVRDGAVNDQRIHKAWATVRDGRGRSAEGVASLVVEEIRAWQDEGLQRADAREAVLKAVRCAAGRLVGQPGEECS
jgi:hypothetical protein